MHYPLQHSPVTSHNCLLVGGSAEAILAARCSAIHPSRPRTQGKRIWVSNGLPVTPAKSLPSTPIGGRLLSHQARDADCQALSGGFGKGMRTTHRQDSGEPVLNPPCPPCQGGI